MVDKGFEASRLREKQRLMVTRPVQDVHNGDAVILNAVENHVVAEAAADAMMLVARQERKTLRHVANLGSASESDGLLS